MKKELDYQKEIKELKDQVSRLTKEMEQTGSRAGRQIKEQAQDYLGEASDYYDKLADEVKEQWSAVSDKTKEAGRKADRYARENPWPTAGMAAAAGFLAALLFSSGRRR